MPTYMQEYYKKNPEKFKRDSKYIYRFKYPSSKVLEVMDNVTPYIKDFDKRKNFLSCIQGYTNGSKVTIDNNCFYFKNYKETLLHLQKILRSQSGLANTAEPNPVKYVFEYTFPLESNLAVFPNANHIKEFYNSKKEFADSIKTCENGFYLVTAKNTYLELKNSTDFFRCLRKL